MITVEEIEKYQQKCASEYLTKGHTSHPDNCQACRIREAISRSKAAQIIMRNLIALILTEEPESIIIEAIAIGADIGYGIAQSQRMDGFFKV
jgi:hypothetical protein